MSVIDRIQQVDTQISQQNQCVRMAAFVLLSKQFKNFRHNTQNTSKHMIHEEVRTTREDLSVAWRHHQLTNSHGVLPIVVVAWEFHAVLPMQRRAILRIVDRPVTWIHIVCAMQFSLHVWWTKCFFCCQFIFFLLKEKWIQVEKSDENWKRQLKKEKKNSKFN